MAYRIDLGQLRSPRKLNGGRLQVEGHLTRSGVFTYVNPDGTTRREYRPDAEVFRPESMQSFALAPLTDQHPDVGLLDSANAKKYAVGWTGEAVRKDGDHVAANMVVMDAEMISKMESGQTVGLSCGYECDLLEVPGVAPSGEHYDAVQKNIRGNHVALLVGVPGRAGPSARVRMDAAVMRDDAEWTTTYMNDLPDSAFLYVEPGGEKDSEGKTTPRSLRHFPVRDASGNVDVAHVRNALARIPQSGVSAEAKAAATAKAERLLAAQRGDRMDPDQKNKLELAAELMAQAKVRADAAESKLDAAVARAEKAEGEAATLKARVDKFEADPDRAEAAKLRQQVTDLGAELSRMKTEKARYDAEEPARFAAAVAARAKLVAEAADVLGGEPKFDASSDRELRLAVLRKINPGVRVDDATSDQYVRGAYEPAIDGWKRTREALSEISRPAAQQPAAPRADAPPAPRDAREAHEQMMRKLHDMGRAPLPSTKAMGA